MCLEKPGPRCSGHTRTNFRNAVASLKEATADLKQKKQALEVAQSAEAKAALEASEKAHAVAVTELNTATAKYDESKAKRAAAMEAYHAAKDEYNASPEGIKKNRLRSVDKKLTAEQREEARKAAIEGNATRNKQKEAYAFKKALDDAEKTAAASEPGFVPDFPSDFSNLSSAEKCKVARSRTLSQVNQVALLSESHEVVHILASRSDLTPEVADKLSEHEDYRIRGKVCITAGMRPETLKKLMSDPEPMVQETARDAYRRLGEYETKASLALKGEGYKSVAHESNNLPTYLLERLADSKQERFTRNIAANSRTNPKRLNALATHSDVNVRTAVALNRNTPSSTIASRIEAGDVDFCKSVFDHNGDKLTVSQLEKMAGMNDAMLRRNALDHPKATPELKARFKR